VCERDWRNSAAQLGGKEEEGGGVGGVREREIEGGRGLEPAPHGPGDILQRNKDNEKRTCLGFRV
jgi:hypothetical protein